MALPKQSPQGDYTGRQAAKLKAEAAARQTEAEADLAAAVLQEQDFRANSTVDLTGGTPIILDGDDVQALATDEEQGAAFRTIRVNQDVEQMTVGAGTSYDFVTGQQYRVPVELADHLEEKGLVWH